MISDIYVRVGGIQGKIPNFSLKLPKNQGCAIYELRVHFKKWIWFVGFPKLLEKKSQ
jgi:hypothetical protein